MHTIGVVGAGGFIGARLVESLTLCNAAAVVPIVRRPSGLALAMRFALDGRVADGRDEAALTRALAGCDSVVHAIAGDPDTIMGTVEPVYRAAERSGCKRLVYLSSASVHGQDPPVGTSEASPLSDRQFLPYNNAKVRAERQLLGLREKGRVEVVILRPGIVYGPRSYWIGGFADELLAGEAYLVGGGTGFINALYVDNLVHAIQLALEARAADGRAYLLGDAEDLTWADFYRPIIYALGFDPDAISHPTYSPHANRGVDLAEWLRRLSASQAMGVLPVPLRKAGGAFLRALQETKAATTDTHAWEPLVSEERARLHTASVKPGWSRAAAELGYKPQVSFDEGSRKSIAWLAFAGYPVHEAESAL